MDARECEKLKHKYDELVVMLQDSLKLYLKEEQEKDKRNKVFLNYKKRVYEDMKKLKSKIQSYEKLLEKYKEKDLELKKENYMLKSKFKHLSAIFKNKKELELIDKYFPDKVKLERLIDTTISKLLSSKFNPKEASVLYFRKYIKVGIKDYLARAIKSKVDSEKLAVVISQIILKEYENFIYTLLAKELLNKLEINEDFIDTLLTKDLVDKTVTYPHLELKNYNLDKIKLILQQYYHIKEKDEDVDALSTQVEMEEIHKEKNKLFSQKEQLKEQLEELKDRENELLALIVSEEHNTEETKEELEEIDESKRVIKDKILSIEKQLTKLQNRELFLKPLLEVKKVKKVDEKEEKYKQQYNQLVSEFAAVLKDLK